MLSNCHLSIAGLGEHNDTAEVCKPGDLTAAITAIIPMPEHLRCCDTLRGFVHLWEEQGRPIPIRELILVTSSSLPFYTFLLTLLFLAQTSTQCY